MTYISAAVTDDRKHVTVWERDEKGKRSYSYYDAPYYFYYQDKSGTYKDIYNNKLKKLEFETPWDFFETKKRYKENNIDLYESDIQPHYKVLAQRYYKKVVGKLNYTFFDIETDYAPERGFASIDDPYARVSAISFYHSKTNTMKVLCLLPENGKWTEADIPADLYEIADIVVCDSEKELLMKFLEEIEDSDILSGWNSEGYDIPYLYFRMIKILGKTYADMLSFENAPKPRVREVEPFPGSIQKRVDIFGRIHIDYLQIFKKFETTQRPSFSLEAISEEILPEMKKLEYEGTLYTLYNDNFPHFVRYNVRDSEVLKGFEDHLGYMEVAILNYHDCTALMNDVTGTVKIVESALINKCHYELDAKAPDSKNIDYIDKKKFAGALVLNPRVGLHEWVFSIDVNSLYPSAIRTLNISPEKLIGQFHLDHISFEKITSKSDAVVTLIRDDGSTENHKGYEWGEILRDRNHALSGFGTVFDQAEQGFIPATLTEWYEDRKRYKKMMSASFDKMKASEVGSDEYYKHKQDYEYYNRVQFIKKLLLNSSYGCLGNIHFKFFDIRMAESTTRTGREALTHMIRTIAKCLDGKEYEWVSAQSLPEDYMFPSESIIYGDTDSCYAVAPVLNLEEAYKAAKIIEGIVNRSFVTFAEKILFCKGDYRDIIKAELDVISDKSIFVTKKYYIMHLFYADGKPSEKMKVMGLQIKKTTIPKPISKALTNYLESFLKGKDWKIIAREIVEYKDVLRTQRIDTIGLPQGIKGIEGYTQRLAAKEAGLRVPGHVRASIFYNKCLEKYGDKESPRIVSDTKIKKFYLKKPFGEYKAIALPTDLKNPPAWFIEHFSDNISKSRQLKTLIDKPLQTILSAIGEVAPTKKTILADDVFGY